jgi:hypothetical protein
MKRYRRMIIEYPLRTAEPTEQPALPLEPPQPAVGDLSIGERFAQFHALNPHVYTSLRALALAKAEQGARRISPKLLFEELRAGGVTTDQGDDTYRLNNIYTSRYARLLASEPALQGRIPTRTLKAE